MPLVLEGEQILFFIPKLVLVGFKRVKSNSEKYLICHYSNISQVGFVENNIEDKNDLSQYHDNYINVNVLSPKDIIKCYKNGENIIIKIHEDTAMKYFNQVKKQLLKKMNDEI